MSETVLFLRMAASLPCDPRHRSTLNKAADEIEQLQATNKELLSALEKIYSHDRNLGRHSNLLNEIGKAITNAKQVMGE